MCPVEQRGCASSDYHNSHWCDMPSQTDTHDYNIVYLEGRKCFIEWRTQHIFIYGYMVSRHTVKVQSDSSKRGNMLPPHRLLFPISCKGSFIIICTIPDRIAHTMTFVTPIMEHWLEQEIAQWVHHEGSIWQPITPWVNTLTTELHLAPLYLVTCFNNQCSQINPQQWNNGSSH